MSPAPNVAETKLHKGHSPTAVLCSPSRRLAAKLLPFVKRRSSPTYVSLTHTIYQIMPYSTFSYYNHRFFSLLPKAFVLFFYSWISIFYTHNSIVFIFSFISQLHKITNCFCNHFFIFFISDEYKFSL